MSGAVGGLLDIDAVAEAILGVLPEQDSPFELHEPELGEIERKHVVACVESGWVSTRGEYVDRFESALADAAGSGYAIATNSGTAALHAALLTAGVSPGSEVLVPALSFAATACAVSYCGAIPHFVDISTESLGVDPEKLASYLAEMAEGGPAGCSNRATGRPIHCLVPVHTNGHPVDVDALEGVAERWGLCVVYDAAAALGTRYRDRPVSQGARLAALSFNGNKIITTGGGGAILTDDLAVAERARHLIGTARIQHPWRVAHDRVGFNYRMPSLNAALGYGQLERLPDLLERKRQLAARYEKAFSDIEGVSFFREPAFACSNYWLNAILLDQRAVSQHDALLERLHQIGVRARPVWEPLHTLPMYDTCPRMRLETTEDVARRLVSLPSSPELERRGG